MQGAKILYVEDEHFLGKIVKESLETRGYHVYMVHDGSHAVAKYRQMSPDICVLDVMLPHKDGYQIGTEIRALNASIPIIYLTAKDQTKDVVKGFKSGGNDYLKKPFSMEELIVRIENLLSMVQPVSDKKIAPAKKIKIGSFVFHPSRLELIHGNQVRKLSHRENQLLMTLYQNRGGTIDRKMILKAIWGDDHFFNSRNLDVYITKLRDYLKADEQVEIITLKGVGYLFVIE